MEALLTPSEIPPLYPGNRLVGYCTLYDMTNFKGKKTEVTRSSQHFSVCVFLHQSVISPLFYSLKDEAIKVHIVAPQVRFLANQMMTYRLQHLS